MGVCPIAFIILHYYAIDDTVACVDSIINKIDTKLYRIIIVNNCSPDNSGRELMQRYEHDTHIVVIHNESNLGFARGNNVGFRYAKKMGCKFIVVLNNDTLLLQNNFYKIIKEEYAQSKFAVLGPLIETPNKDLTSNPGRNTIMTKRELKSFVSHVRIRLFLNQLCIEPIYDFVKNRLIKIDSTPKVDYTKRCENVSLHGCCLIFSPEFVKRYEGFNEGTFLYLEEEILFAEMMQAGMKTVYNPDLKIYHKEDASLNSLKNNQLKKRFQYKNALRSALVLEKVITSIAIDR